MALQAQHNECAQLEYVPCRYARRCFDDAVLVGIFSAKDKRPTLNPGEDVVITDRDRLIVLSHNSAPLLCSTGLGLCTCACVPCALRRVSVTHQSVWGLLCVRGCVRACVRACAHQSLLCGRSPDLTQLCAGLLRPNKEGPLQLFHEAAAKRSDPGRVFQQRRNQIEPQPIEVRGPTSHAGSAEKADDQLQSQLDTAVPPSCEGQLRHTCSCLCLLWQVQGMLVEL